MNVQYHGGKGLPELPVFGMRFVMPTKADGYVYEGYQGRLIGSDGGQSPGVYEVDGLPVTPYLCPQNAECTWRPEMGRTVYRSKTLDDSSENVEKVRSYVYIHPVKTV